jgi:GT2 family glycosyltransferase
MPEIGAGRNQSMGTRILIGMPAYRGTEHIAETLRCIAEQEFTAFEVLISIDNADYQTAETCGPFLADRRFRMVVQQEHLGWARNTNWVMAQCDAEFFCYWQQDDLTTPDYLRSLIRFADDNPDCVCTFCDLQWFGAAHTRMSCPSLTGFALTRALYFLETMNGVPFRGLIRKAAIDRVGPIRQKDFSGAHEDFVWLAKLARDGAFGHVPGPLYYKRKHEDSVSSSWDRRGRQWWRAAWLEFGIGMLEAILPAVAPDERETALRVVLERLCYPKKGRRLPYDPGSECWSFATEFLTTARARCALPPGDDARIVTTIVNLVRAHAQALDLRFTPFMRELDQRRTLDLGFQPNATGSALLDSGWSAPEAWGAWSNGRESRLRLPLAADGRKWRIVFQMLAYANADHAQRVRVMLAGDELARWAFKSNTTYDRELSVLAQENHPLLTFLFPDAVSPQQLGESRDARTLAIGLIKITISQADVPSN